MSGQTKNKHKTIKTPIKNKHISRTQNTNKNEKKQGKLEIVEHKIQILSDLVVNATKSTIKTFFKFPFKLTKDIK